jgi:signal peptidase I
MQEFRPEDEPRESTADPGQPLADPPRAELFSNPAPAELFSDPAPVALFPDPAPAELPEAVVFRDPGDENPVPYSPAADPFARPGFTPLPPPADQDSAHMMRRLEAWRDEFFAWVRTLASAAVYATLIVTFGFQVARVEGQSMAPTLADQDRLIVNKLRYRLTSPQRGDIVMLYYPLNPDKSFVKRVIAEEGDTVRVVDGRVYVNDVPMRDDFVPAEYRSHDDWGPQVIPEGYYFVMGDHRNNSSDSRHWGFVPKKYIIGKVQVRWWPVPQAKIF